MRRIEVSDINRRIKGLKESSGMGECSALKYSTISTMRPDDIIRTVESTVKDNKLSPFGLYLEALDIVNEKGTKGQFDKLATFLIEETTPKVRNASELLYLLHARLGKIKGRLNVQNRHEDTKENIEDELKTPAPAEGGGENKQQSQQEAAYEKLIEKAEIYSNCDRVIENFDRVSERFNLSLLFDENARINGTYDTVIELCKRIDTYDIPDPVKLNTVLELSILGFANAGNEFKRSDIVEAGVDYFYFKEDAYNTCKTVLDTTLFYDKDEDMGNCDILMEEEPEEEEKSVKEVIESYCQKISGSDDDTHVLNEVGFNEIFKKFKKEEVGQDKHPERKLRSLICKLYSRNVDSIVDDTPNLLSWIRTFFIVSSAAIPIVGPAVAVIGVIADRFISLHCERQEVEQMLKCFNQEIKKTKDKLKTVKDPEEKANLEKYLKSLKDAKNKIDMYLDDLLTEKERDERYENMDADDIDLSDLGFDFDDDDWWNECASVMQDIELNYTLLDADLRKSRPTYNETKSIVSRLDDVQLVETSKIISRYPDMFNILAFKAGIMNQRQSIMENTKAETNLTNSIRLTTLDEAEKYLSNPTEPEKTVNLYANLYELEAIRNVYEAFSILGSIDPDTTGVVMENSILNTLKMAGIKLRSAMQKMNDKEKQISRSIDVGLNSFMKNVENQLTNENRKSVVEGSILPSASKVIKLAIVNAGLVMLGQPIIAIIGTLGYLGVSARFKDKERQSIIDEIEIELKMCQKYIDLAESKNDMKALKQLLTIQRELERQRQRLKYKMKVVYKRSYYDAKPPQE